MLVSKEFDIWILGFFFKIEWHCLRGVWQYAKWWASGAVRLHDFVIRANKYLCGLISILIRLYTRCESGFMQFQQLRLYSRRLYVGNMLGKNVVKFGER